jgi:hypothetical protein
VNNPATAPQYPPRNANLDVVEGNLQRISRKFHADRSLGSSLVSPLGLNIALKCWGMAADGD